VATEVFVKKMKPFSTDKMIKESLETIADIAILIKGT
jgi:hypothetical protein